MSYFFWEESLSISRMYVNSYELTNQELESRWIPITSNFFEYKDSHSELFLAEVANAPSLSEGLLVWPVLSGGILDKEELISLKCCMEETGDREFALIEICDSLKSSAVPRLRFKYPKTIKWSDFILIDDNDEKIQEGITYELERMVRKYLLVGDSGYWIKYVDNDANDGMGISFYLLNPAVYNLFEKHFSYTKQEKEEYKSSLPVDLLIHVPF